MFKKTVALDIDSIIINHLHRGLPAVGVSGRLHGIQENQLPILL